jgi:hypothetical protein
VIAMITILQLRSNDTDDPQGDDRPLPPWRPSLVYGRQY